MLLLILRFKDIIWKHIAEITKNVDNFHYLLL
jgi:hypothetical protein